MKIFTGIHFINATTEELEKALPFTKGKWKPYNTPVFNSNDFKSNPIKLDVSEGKWKPALPYIKNKKL